jgi:hypothetical protein
VLDLAHDVIAEIADESTVKRREPLDEWCSEGSQELVERHEYPRVEGIAHPMRQLEISGYLDA